MKAPKIRIGRLTRRPVCMETSRSKTKRKPSPKAQKPDSLLKRFWRQVRKVDWKSILEFLKVLAVLKGLFL